MTPASGATRARDALRVELLAAVAAGGALGSLGRYGVAEAMPHTSAELPVGTLLVNVTGAFALGLLTAWLASRGGAHRLLRPFLGVGVLGGWTTFSALAVEAVVAVDAGHAGVALAYLGVSFGLGLIAVVAGEGLGRAMLGDLP